MPSGGKRRIKPREEGRMLLDPIMSLHNALHHAFRVADDGLWTRCLETEANPV